jgi:hypothetical protein
VITRALAVRRIAVARTSLTWEETKVLEWKPRFTAILVVLTLVLTAAVASGYAEWFFDNWEW